MAVFFLAPKPCAAGFYWQPNKHDGLQLTLLNKLVGLAFTKLLFYFQTKKTGKRAVKHVMLYQQRPTALLAYSHATQLNLE